MSKNNKKPNKIDAGEWLAGVPMFIGLMPIAARAVDEGREAAADGVVTAAEVRGIVLRALGLPDVLPTGPVGDVVDWLVASLAD